jgi:hypothetical protein
LKPSEIRTLVLETLLEYERVKGAKPKAPRRKAKAKKVKAKADMLLLAEDTERGEQVLDSKAQRCNKEMAMGRYYFGKQDWFPAMNRFKIVMAQCPGSSDAGEALARLNEIFLRLGLTSEAK